MGNYKQGGLEKSKYIISKSDGSDVDPKADYFVLRIDADPNAQESLIMYMFLVNRENHILAKDISDKLCREYGWTEGMLKQLYVKAQSFINQSGIFMRTEVLKNLIEIKQSNKDN